MRKYVFTIKDDVCAANGKDPEAVELLAKMKLWGDVEDYDKALAAVRSEYQEIIDGLNARLFAINEKEITDDELVILLSYRGCKQSNAEKYQARIDELERNALETAEDLQKKVAVIHELFPEALGLNG